MRSLRHPAPWDRRPRQGGGAYDRRLHLPPLIAIYLGDLHGPEIEIGRALCARLAKALRQERNRGRSGQSAYSLNRHIGLMQALKEERRLLAGAIRAERAIRTA